MKPIGPDMRSQSVRAQQNMRTFDAIPWAPRSTNSLSVGLSKLVIFGLTPVCFLVWLVVK